MSGSLSRRAFAAGAAALGLSRTPVWAQGFAGLGMNAQGFAAVVLGKTFAFPADHGPHPDYRIEWWYLTANLADASGNAYGAQWTLFRQALSPGAQQEGWANQQIWMGHAAVTSANAHRFSEIFARGGIGQAGVEDDPFKAWIDSWEMRGLTSTNASTIAPLELTATGPDFGYTLHLDTDRALVLQGDAGFSRKSEREQASYYYSQPFFNVAGSISIDDKPVEVSGRAWMDREWSSQPLAPDQNGWDWFSLHLGSGEKLMLYRMRQTDGNNYSSGNWISADGSTAQLFTADIHMAPRAFTEIERRQIPTAWRIAVPSRGLEIDCVALNPESWMGTSFRYWEGPIRFRGSHDGLGYLELTGY